MRLITSVSYSLFPIEGRHPGTRCEFLVTHADRYQSTADPHCGFTMRSYDQWVART